MRLQHLDLDGYLGLVQFGEGQPPRFRKDWRHSSSLLAHQLSVDEGHFGQNGEFVVDRWRNGDEVSSGTWVEPDVRVVWVIMCD